MIFVFFRLSPDPDLEKKPPLENSDPVFQGGVSFQRGGYFSRISPDAILVVQKPVQKKKSNCTTDRFELDLEVARTHFEYSKTQIQSRNDSNWGP